MGARKRRWGRRPKHRRDLAEWLDESRTDEEYGTPVPMRKVNGDRAEVVRAGSWADKRNSSFGREYREHTRFLNSRIGHPWDNVWSEVCEKYKKDKDRHRREEIRDRVAINTESIYCDKYVVDNGILRRTTKDDDSIGGRWGRGKRNPTIPKDEFLSLFIKAAETRQGGVNRILKQMGLSFRPCTTDDPCITEVEVQKIQYYVLTKKPTKPGWRGIMNLKFGNWRKKISTFERQQMVRDGKGDEVCIHKSTEIETKHDHGVCCNRVLLRSHTDGERVGNQVWDHFCRWRYYREDWKDKFFQQLLQMMGWKAR